MTFTLALLGTDTNYQTTLNPDEYPLGETLSIAASLIAHHRSLAPLLDDGVEHLCHQNFHLINGPTTLGAEVYDRIKRGFFACLRAVKAGYTQINIFAHSRGGAESILLAHELNRLQSLGTNLSLTNINDSSVAKLKVELQKLGYTEDDLVAMKQYLPQLRLSMFVLDPVPGDGYLGIGWYEEGFKNLPPIVKHFEEYVYEHEQTRFFYPVIPKPHDEQASRYQLQILPGHHGSGSGNAYDQAKLWKTTRFPLGFKLEHTQELQKLVLIKLAYFLIQQGSQFRLSNRFPPYSAAVIAVLSPWSELVQSMQLNPKAVFLQELIGIYQYFVEDKAIQTFILFMQTSYPVLGRLSGDNRFIYHHGNGIYLNQLPNLARDDSSYFFNSEHMQLVVDSILSISRDEDPLAYLDKLMVFFGNKISTDPNLETLAGSQGMMIHVLADAIRGPYISGYYNTQDKMQQLVEKVRQLMNLFVQEGEHENTRSLFFRGLQTELEKTLGQRMKNLSKLLSVQLENTWEINLLHEFHQALEQIVQDIDWPEGTALGLKQALFESLTHLSEDILHRVTNFAEIPDIITAYRQRIETEYDAFCHPLIHQLQVFEAKLREIRPDEEKRQHHRVNIQAMLDILQQMQDVTKISEQFDDALLLVSEQRELQQRFLHHLRQLLNYLKIHHLGLNMALDSLPAYPDLFSSLMQEPAFLALCEQDFRQDWLALRNSSLTACEALKVKYAFLWSATLSLGLERLKTDYEKRIVQLKVETIVAQSNTLGHSLEELLQVQQLLQQLEQIKAGFAKPRQLDVRIDGVDVLPNLEALKHQAMHACINRAIDEIKVKFPRLQQNLSGWVQRLNVEILAYQLKCKTQVEQDVLTELQQPLKDKALDIEKLVCFCAEFHKKADILSLHHDPLWLQNLKNFAVIFPSMLMVTGIVASTILAGPLLTALISVLSLVCLVLEAAVIHQARGHFGFWRPHGNDFVKKIEQIENNISSSLSK